MLACRYFDRGLAGYLDEDDLRDIASMTGDYMSRERHSRPSPSLSSATIDLVIVGMPPAADGTDFWVQGCGDFSLWASEYMPGGQT